MRQVQGKGCRLVESGMQRPQPQQQHTRGFLVAHIPAHVRSPQYSAYVHSPPSPALCAPTCGKSRPLAARSDTSSSLKAPLRAASKIAPRSDGSSSPCSAPTYQEGRGVSEEPQQCGQQEQVSGRKQRVCRLQECSRSAGHHQLQIRTGTDQAQLHSPMPCCVPTRPSLPPCLPAQLLLLLPINTTPHAHATPYTTPRAPLSSLQPPLRPCPSAAAASS